MAQCALSLLHPATTQILPCWPDNSDFATSIDLEVTPTTSPAPGRWRSDRRQSQTLFESRLFSLLVAREDANQVDQYAVS